MHAHNTFAGIHRTERPAQELDTLVLFNTAISNLVCLPSIDDRDGILTPNPRQVLFRNNFTLSRDITGLFQSFQSSSTVLDSVANTALFQSTLVIIIKDVADSDKAEIARE